MSLTIRRASATDAAVIVEYNRHLAEETEHKILDPATLAAGVAAALSDPHKAIYFVAELNGEVVGQLSITTEWSDWRNGWVWWLQSVYVRADARRHGVFRALYEHLHRTACADPAVVALRLYVEQDNRVAQQTYRRLGMEPAGFLVMQKWPL
jgi:ribosomal protein S18 acetylase RimI-like enzyme